MEPPPESPTAKPSPTVTVNKPLNFWLTTGLSAVLVAALGVVGTLLAQRAGKSVAAPVVVTKTVTVSVAAPATAGAGQTGAQQGQGGAQAQPGQGIRWQGRFLLRGYVDFSATPPTNGGGGVFPDGGSDGTLSLGDSGSVWTGAQPPTKQQCSDAVDTRSADSAPGVAGTQVCFRTKDSIVVYLKILSRQQDELSSAVFDTDLTIWN